MLDWLLDWIPLWLWVALAAVALLAAWRFLGLRGMLASMAAAVTVLAYRQGRRTGGEDERAKRLREQNRAAQERDEMRAEGQAAEQAAEGMTDEEARKEALEWSRKR